MKLIIAGTRYFSNYTLLKNEVLNYLKKLNISPFDKITIVSGGAGGADYLGEKFAQEMNYPIEVYKADWKAHGKAAGPIRNKEMAKLSDFAICFWDNQSKGTQSMINEMRKLNKPVRVIIF